MYQLHTTFLVDSLFSDEVTSESVNRSNFEDFVLQIKEFIQNDDWRLRSTNLETNQVLVFSENTHTLSDVLKEVSTLRS